MGCWADVLLVAASASALVVPSGVAGAAGVGASACCGLALERRASWDGPTVALVCGSVLSNAGVVPAASGAYDVCWGTLLPASLALTLLGQEDGRERPSRGELGRVGRAFAVGAAGSVLGGVVAARVGAPLLGRDTAAKGAACLAASFVGGSANFFQVSRAVGLGDSSGGRGLVAALAAADVLVMAAYFLGLQALSGGDAARAPSAPRETDVRSSPADFARTAVVAAACLVLTRPLGASARTAALAAAAVVGRAAAATTGARGAARSLAGCGLALFYAAVGASAPVAAVADAGAGAIVLAGAALVAHACALGAATRACRGAWTPMEACVASNACVGGPSTAAAFAANRGRDDLVLPAVAWGTVGYAVATGLGVALHGALR